MNKKKYTRKSKTILNIFEDGGSTSSSSSSVSNAVLGGVGNIVGNVMSQMPNLAQLNADPSIDQDINDAIYGDSSQDPISRMISDISGQSTKKAVDKLKKKDVLITADNNDDLMSVYDNLDFRNKVETDEGLEWKTAVSTALGAPWLDFQDGGVQFSGDNLAASAQGAAQGLSVGGPWGALAGGILGGIANLVSRLGRNKRINKINKAIDERNEYLRSSFNNAVSNTATQSSLNALANYSAYGGHLNLYNNGGGVHIDSSKKGTFTAAAKKRGLGVQEFANKVLANKDNYSTAMVKKANFARNFGGRKKAYGGFVEGGEYDNHIPNSVINPIEGSTYPTGYNNYPTKRDLIELEIEYYNNYPYSKEYAEELEELNDKITNNKDNMKVNSYNRYALGGTLNPDSEYIDEINEYNTGGTHEENPYEGVQIGVDPQGTPNMVEEGEVRYGDYIFSNRLAPDKSLLEEFKLPTSYKNHTFADIAEKLSKEYREKPNDPIVKNGTLASLERLKASQEKLKMQEAEKRRNRENEITSMLQQQQLMQEPDMQEQIPADINNNIIQQSFPNEEVMNANIPPSEVGRLFAEGGSLYRRVRNRNNNTINNNNYDKEIQNKNLQGERQGNTYNLQEGNTNNSQSDNTSRIDNNSSIDNVVSTFNNTSKNSFKSAFAKARKEGKKTFKWNGNEYFTELAEEKKSNKSTDSRNTYEGLTFKQAFSRARSEGLKTFWWKNREYTTRGKEEDDNTWQQRLQNIKSKKSFVTNEVNKEQEGQEVNKKANGGSINRFDSGNYVQNRNRDEAIFKALPLDKEPLYKKYIKNPDEALFNALPLDKEPLYKKNIKNIQNPMEQGNEAIQNKLNYYKQQGPPLKSKINSTEDKGYPAWLRYAPVVGAGLGVLTDTLGLTNTPDYENADLIGNTVDNLTDYDYNPIGNYVKYIPLDRNYYINKMNAQAGATRNAILNNANGNRAMANANIIAADYNAMNSLGNLARAAEEYNNDLQLKTEDFNRGTNMFNRQMDIQAYNANQANNQLRLHGRMAEAEMRNNIENMASAGRNANLTNFFNSLGDIGRENFSMNMIKFDPSGYYWIDKKGVTHYRDMSHLTDGQKEAVKASAESIRRE